MRPRPLLVQTVLITALLVSASTASESPPRVGFQGMGSARIGISLWDLLVSLGEHVTIESVEGGCTSLYKNASSPPELIFMVVDGRLARIEVRTPDISTFSGVSVGETESDVFTAYPGRVEVSDHEYQEGHYLTIYSADRESALVFDTDGTAIRSFRVGRLPEVLHVEGCS